MTKVATFCAPAFHHVPAHVGTYGDEVADLAETVGLALDPEQRLLVDAMYAHDARGRLVAPEVGCAAPRQVIKTHVGKIAALADLVLFDEPMSLWTAHLRTTSDKAHLELVETFENYDHLRRLVHSMTDSDGEKSIKLRRPAAGEPHPELTFMTRSERGGRGLTGRRVTFDEALFLKSSMTSAMVPVLSAQSLVGDVQVRYLGSAGLKHSAVWREIRDRGRRGDARRLAWLEWMAPPTECEQDLCAHAPGTDGCALDREDLVRAANLAIDRRMDIAFVLGTERLALPPLDFMRERFGWWDDPPNSDGGDLDVDAFLLLEDVTAIPVKPLMFGVDQGEDRTISIGCAWRRPDKSVQVMLSQGERLDSGLSPDQAIDRLVALRKRWNARVVLGGPAIGLEHELRDKGVPVDVLSGAEFATACGQLDDRIRAGTLRHGNQTALNDSVRGARWRQVGTAGERAFQLKNAPGIGPLAAVTRALSGLLALPITPPSKPKAVKSSVTSGLAAKEF